MWPVIGFLIAAAIGVTTVFVASRREAAQRGDYPWLLDEVMKLHVVIVGTLAGFAFTGVVLVVTLARDRPAAAQIPLDSVIAMFLVAYLWWVGGAFLISYLPHIGRSGDVAQRVHFTLASTIEYRTVFLSWFALLPLIQTSAMSHLVPILDYLLPISLILGSILLAMAIDGLGLMRIKEIYFSAVVGTVLALAYAAIVEWVAPSARTPYSPLYFALVIFAVNGLGFILASLTPLSSRYDGIKRLVERYGRQLVVADMHLTMASLLFLWLAVVGVI